MSEAWLSQLLIGTPGGQSSSKSASGCNLPGLSPAAQPGSEPTLALRPPLWAPLLACPSIPGTGTAPCPMLGGQLRRPGRRPAPHAPRAGEAPGNGAPLLSGNVPVPGTACMPQDGSVLPGLWLSLGSIHLGRPVPLAGEKGSPPLHEQEDASDKLPASLLAVSCPFLPGKSSR